MNDVPVLLGYGLVMWGGIVLMIAYGLTGMVSRYAKFASPDRHFTAFDIYFACGVLGVFMVLWLVGVCFA